MSSILPAPEMLLQLSTTLKANNTVLNGNWGKFKTVMATLTKTILQSGISSAAQYGITAGVAAAGVKSGVVIGAGLASVAIAPIGAALAPWIAAIAVGRKVTRVNTLIDLRDDAKAGGTSKAKYVCNCGKCAGNIDYIVEKEHARVARIAVYATGVGLPLLFFKTIHSIGKSFQSGRPKEMACRGLTASALGGCTVAMATIYHLIGEPTKENLCTGVAIMTASDGWEELKKLI